MICLLRSALTAPAPIHQIRFLHGVKEVALALASANRGRRRRREYGPVVWLMGRVAASSTAASSLSTNHTGTPVAAAVTAQRFTNDRREI